MKKVVFLLLCGFICSVNAAYSTSGLKLHLDVDSLSGLENGDVVSSWQDSSGNGNDVMSPGEPVYIADSLNGHGVVSITGSADLNGNSIYESDGVTVEKDNYFALTDTIHNVKTIAMVFKRTTNVYYTWAPILGGEAGSNPFHGDASYGTAYWNSWADPSVRYSDLWINGDPVGAGNAEYRSVPTDFHVMTMTVQDGWGTDVTISEIARSINYTDHSIYGMDLAELLVYDQFLSVPQLEQLTGYLGNKYDIAVSVPEPGSLILLAAGACWLRRKCK